MSRLTVFLNLIVMLNNSLKPGYIFMFYKIIVSIACMQTSLIYYGCTLTGFKLIFIMI